MVGFIRGCASIGHGRSKKEIIAMVQELVKKKGMDGAVTNGWWASFVKRHGDITIRTAEPLAYVRFVCSKPEIPNAYFDLLEKTLVDNDLLGQPCLIFNCDESGFPLSPRGPKVAAGIGQKHPTSVTGNKGQITVLACCSAGGYAIPPLVIFDRKCLKPELTHGEVPGTMYGLTDSGWMNGEIFDSWFKHHFLAYAPPARPLILLLDGHSSH